MTTSHSGSQARAVTSGASIGFIAHLIVYVLSCLLLVVVAGFYVASIVALAWGIGLASHGFFALVIMVRRADRNRSGDSGPSSLPPAVPSRAPAAHDAPRVSVAHNAQRVRSMEELSAAIAHEIRNPITAAKSLVQLLAEDPGAPDAREHARVAIDELDRVERSIAHLLRFAREEPFEPVELDVNELIDSAIDLVSDRAAREHVRIERDIERLPSAFADGEQLRKVLSNLIANALDAHAGHAGEDPFVRITAGQNLAGSELWIRVRDNGPGIPRALAGKVFRPFYTSKAGGTGLGLALAHKVLERHGGSIELVDHPGQGAEFLLVLPRRPRRVEGRS
jgi:signal transduction histidine kinase